MVVLESEYLKVEVHPKGAELQRIYHKSLDLEYMWDGNPEFWGKHSPVLFPIVGALKEDTYFFEGKAYKLPRHGFARDLLFEIESCSETEATFLLKSTEDTMAVYPFHFELRLKYRLQNDALRVSYLVKNTSDKTMFFSIGAHPAFRVPLETDRKYEDYFLEFSSLETSQRYTLQNNLISRPVPFLDAQSTLQLKPELFYDDALVFKDLGSDCIALKCVNSAQGLELSFAGFPYMGFWAAKNAPFLCIEPWCGIADHEDHGQRLEDKEGIIALQSDKLWERSWTLRCF